MFLSRGVYHAGMLTDPEEDYKYGYVPFLGVKILLDSKPLVPRTETEHWVERAIEEIPEDTCVCVLDLFSGSGCIGVAILKHRPHTVLTFAEIEENHLETTKKSLEVNDIDSKRAFFQKSDVWSAVGGCYNFVFTNPPYVSKERSTLDAGVDDVEPRSALFADEDGYAYIREVIDGLPKFLAKKGVCFIEHEPFHSEKIHKQVSEIGFKCRIEKDQYGVERYTRITR